MAITYMDKQSFDKSRAIFEEMEKVGASDSATQTNHGVAILNKLISKHKIEPTDEADFEKAKRARRFYISGDATKFNWIVFAVAFVFSFVLRAVLPGISSNLTRTLNPEMWELEGFSMNVVGFILSLSLLFASFYLIGRNIDLVSDFPLVLVPLFVGSLAGRLVGFLLLYAGSYVLIPAPPTLLQFFEYGLNYLYMAFSYEFFIGFTALSIAYIVKKRS